jgi:hypothetical protein
LGGGDITPPPTQGASTGWTIYDGIEYRLNNGFIEKKESGIVNISWEGIFTKAFLKMNSSGGVDIWAQYNGWTQAVVFDNVDTKDLSREADRYGNDYGDDYEVVKSSGYIAVLGDQPQTPLSPQPLTVVQNYTVSHTGDTQYASLDWNSLNDGVWTTGVGTGTYYSTKGDCSIVVNLGSSKLIKRIEIAGGYMGGIWGDTIAKYLNDGILEYSIDGIQWTNYAVIAGVTDASGDYKQYNPDISAQYWRIRRLEWCATSAFIFYV